MNDVKQFCEFTIFSPHNVRSCKGIRKIWNPGLWNPEYSSRIAGIQARSGGVGGGVSRGSNEPPLLVSDGGLKTQAVNFQLSANSGGMENKL